MANSSSALDRIFRHWAWAIPVILIVAALSIRQFDFYKPSLDEFYSLNSAGLVIDGPLSPMVLISRLHLDAPDHMPGYFLFLSAWGNLVSSDLAIARVAGINASYVGRILRLALLAPDIVAVILDGRQPPELTMARLMKRFPLAQKRQRACLLDR